MTVDAPPGAEAHMRKYCRPILQMVERIATDSEHSATDHCLALLRALEMTLKLKVALLAALVDEGTEREQWQAEAAAVKADGVGKWSEIGARLLTHGPIAGSFASAVEDMTKSTDALCWYRRSCLDLQSARAVFDPHSEALPKRTSLVHWMHLAAEIRNKSLGHASPPAKANADAVRHLQAGLTAIWEASPLLALPVAYLHTDLTGTTRAAWISSERASGDISLPEQLLADGPGVYVYCARWRRVRLMSTDPRLSDFWFPNGNWRDKGASARFEMLSYVTNHKLHADGAVYRGSAVALPTSHTRSTGELDALNELLTNAPPEQPGYITRQLPEAELYDVLSSEHRHPIVTLHGRGGIGKTSLALHALQRLSHDNRFLTAVWFSSRDIDLLDYGAKRVEAEVLTLEDVAKFYKRSIGDTSKTPALEVFGLALTAAQPGPGLFIFDNFETVRDPVELFRFIDDRIRLPNKVLITTRHYTFKGDYPIEVGGMEREECAALISQHAHTLGITELVTPEYERSLLTESGGHPYAIKVLLGEVARSRKTGKIEKVFAGQSEILDALFERTYRTLTEPAQRVFLTLAAWRSVVPLVAIEAVMLRNTGERIDVHLCIDELRRYSFVEVEYHSDSEMAFLSVPLTAATFGKQKLIASPDRAAVDADLVLLRQFGVMQKSDIQHGLEPRIVSLFKFVATEVSFGRLRLDDIEPMLEFLAKKWNPAWRHLARLRRELTNGRDLDGEKHALRSFLEHASGQDAFEVWRELATVCRADQDVWGEIHALAQIAESNEATLYDVSWTLNQVNFLLRQYDGDQPKDERAALLRRFAFAMESRVREASGDDLSRLAWIYIRLGDLKRAYDTAALGLQREADNYHCIQIANRLSRSAC